MISSSEAFLKSYNNIQEFEAEYSILSEYDERHKGKTFFIKLSKIEHIRQLSGNIHELIQSEYKEFYLQLFLCDSEKINIEFVDKYKSGSSYTDTELKNIALRESKNSNYVLLRTDNVFCLYYNGEYDTKFKNKHENSEDMKKLQYNLCELDELNRAFIDYHEYRKGKNIFFTKNNLIIKDISEQKLRNNIADFLKNKVKGKVSFEEATSTMNDEESVDIAIKDKNGREAIIEVKLMISKDFIEGGKKNLYSFYRFKDGYKQLKKYCDNMISDERKLHSAYLYMFYAYNCEKDKIISEKNKYENECKKSYSLTYFNTYYKDTILDDMMDCI